MNANPIASVSRLARLALGVVGVAAVALVLVACADDASGEGAAREILDSLPAYEGASLVFEYEAGADDGETVVRLYAVEGQPEEAANQITLYYRDYLVEEGWQEGPARAGFSSFTSDEGQVIVGRVGPEAIQLPADADVTVDEEPPAGAGFFFTLEATAR